MAEMIKAGRIDMAGSVGWKAGYLNLRILAVTDAVVNVLHTNGGGSQ